MVEAIQRYDGKEAVSQLIALIASLVTILTSGLVMLDIVVLAIVALFDIFWNGHLRKLWPSYANSLLPIGRRAGYSWGCNLPETSILTRHNHSVLT